MFRKVETQYLASLLTTRIVVIWLDFDASSISGRIRFSAHNAALKFLLIAFDSALTAVSLSA